MCRSLVGCLLLASILLSSAPAAHATSVTVTGGPGTAAEIVSAAADELTSMLLASLEIKEFVLDEIAFMLAKAALSEITSGVVDWINSGFQGDPAFVTDLEQYLLDAADEVAGNIIYGTDLGFLCSPLELDVRLALEIQYAKSNDLGYAVQCTLSDVVGNVEDFYNGNFLAGGWPGWFEFVTKPQNNIYGATAIASARLENEILAAQNRKLETLQWGEGFLSFEECQEVGPKKIKKCKTVTPGQVISEQLTFELSVGERTLIEADELNEVISALLGQLGSMALQGAGGLFGLSGGGSGGGSSYTSQLRQSGGVAGTGPGAGGSGQAISFIAGAIADERAFRSIVQPAIDRAVNVAAEATTAGSCGTNDAITADAETIRAEYAAEINESLTTEASLQGMQFRYDAADADERLLITEEFENLRTTGALHTQIGNVRVGFEIDDALAELNQMATRIQICPNQSGSDPNRNER